MEASLHDPRITTLVDCDDSSTICCVFECLDDKRVRIMTIELQGLKKIQKIINARLGMEPYFREHPELMKISDYVKSDLREIEAELKAITPDFHTAAGHPYTCSLCNIKNLIFAIHSATETKAHD